MDASLCQRMCLLRRPLKRRRRRSLMARTLPSHTLSRCSAPPPSSMMQVGHAHIARDLALQAALACQSEMYTPGDQAPQTKPM